MTPHPELTAEDPEVARLLTEEETRQAEAVYLIPSENFVSAAVKQAVGSVFMNKYAEGYPGKRYYAGQQTVDQLENLTIERAKALFGAEHANVQPYSGSPANLAVYQAVLELGDTILSLSLANGGHLTHGHGVSAVGKLYHVVNYGLDDHERIDMAEVEALAKEHRPKLIISGATAYPRQIDFQRFQAIADSVGALHLADISHLAGLIVGGQHPSPFPFTDLVTTTTHKTLRGPRGAIIFSKAQFAAAVDKAVFPGLQGGPHENSIAGIAVALKEASEPSFKQYAKQIVQNAQAFAAELQTLGFRLVSGGTDNHLLLVDLTPKNLGGKLAQERLEAAGVIVNKNMIPADPRKPFDPSGLRLGTPAMTTRGWLEADFRAIAHKINAILAS